MDSRKWKNRKNSVRQRDGDNCWLCKKPMLFSGPNTHKEFCTVDHFLPKRLGGSNRIKNIKLAHRKCNNERELNYPETLVFTEKDKRELIKITRPETINPKDRHKHEQRSHTERDNPSI